MTTDSRSNMVPAGVSGPDSHPFAPRLLRGYLWAIVIVSAGVQAFGIYTQEILRHHLSDFGRMFHALLAWQQHGALYGSNIATPMRLPNGSIVEIGNVASPAWHLLVWPFTFLPPTAAFVAWLAVNIVAWVACVRICIDEWRITIDYRWYPALALALLVSPLTAGAFHTGQYVGLLMVPATLAWRAARVGQFARSGWWLGLVAAHKPFVLVFVAWLGWHRQWRAVIGALLAAAATLAAGAAVFGVDAYEHWRVALENTSQWTWLYVNASVWAPWARAFGQPGAFASSNIPALASIPAVACAAVVGAMSWWHLRRRQLWLDREWSVLWLAALLMSPLGWTYYLWLGLGPLGAILLEWQRTRERRTLRLVLGIVAVLPLSFVLVAQPSPLASFTIGSIYVWALLAWWAAIIADGPGRSAASARTSGGG